MNEEGPAYNRRHSADIVGVILAGGRGTRMHDSDKPLLTLHDRCLVDHVISRARPQVNNLVISANRNIDQYRQRRFLVLKDEIEGYAGALAGIASAMHWARRQDFPLLACFPGDVPLFPDNVVALLHQIMRTEHSEVAWLCTDGQLQPLFSLWSTALYPAVRSALQNQVYSPMQFIRGRKHSLLQLDNCPAGYFDNLNSEEDLERARSRFS